MTPTHAHTSNNISPHSQHFPIQFIQTHPSFQPPNPPHPTPQVRYAEASGAGREAVARGLTRDPRKGGTGPKKAEKSTSPGRERGGVGEEGEGGAEGGGSRLAMHR